MIDTLKAVGEGCGLVLDASLLSALKLKIGSRVEIHVTPDGKGLLVTPVGEPEAKDEHRARVQEASQRAIGRHRAAFKKLAE